MNSGWWGREEETFLLLPFGRSCNYPFGFPKRTEELTLSTGMGPQEGHTIDIAKGLRLDTQPPPPHVHLAPFPLAFSILSQFNVTIYSFDILRFFNQGGT